MKIWRKRFPETIAHYLNTYGKWPFHIYPLNDVDSLLICQLAYLRFDGLVPWLWERRSPVRLGDLELSRKRESLFRNVLFAEENRLFFGEMARSRRFRELKLDCYVNLIEKEQESQFAAVTCLLEDGTIYVAFRGTDATLVGWKEDFNMAFRYPVPGQALAAKYLNTVLQRFPQPFYVGGHSKGGNFAVYSAMYCAAEARRRILKIYNMDGPGFWPAVLASDRYAAVADKVVKYMPHSSVVGMLFAGDGRYNVVESRGFGLAQHNPFRWKIRSGRFVLAQDIYAGIRCRDKALNDWIWSLDEARIRLFVDTLYHVVSAAQAEDLFAVIADWKNNISCARKAIREVDGETMRALREILGALFGALWARKSTE